MEFEVGIDTVEAKAFQEVDRERLDEIYREGNYKQVPFDRLRAGERGLHYLIDGYKVGAIYKTERSRRQYVRFTASLDEVPSTVFVGELERVLGQPYTEVENEVRIVRLDARADTGANFATVAPMLNILHQQSVGTYRKFKRRSLEVGKRPCRYTAYELGSRQRHQERGRQGTRIEAQMHWRYSKLPFRTLHELLHKPLERNPLEKVQFFRVEGADPRDVVVQLILERAKTMGSVQAAIKSLNSPYLEHKYRNSLKAGSLNSLTMLQQFRHWLHDWRLPLLRERGLPVQRCAMWDTETLAPANIDAA